MWLEGRGAGEEECLRYFQLVSSTGPVVHLSSVVSPSSSSFTWPLPPSLAELALPELGQPLPEEVRGDGATLRPQGYR